MSKCVPHARAHTVFQSQFLRIIKLIVHESVTDRQKHAICPLWLLKGQNWSSPCLFLSNFSVSFRSTVYETLSIENRSQEAVAQYQLLIRLTGASHLLSLERLMSLYSDVLHVPLLSYPVAPLCQPCQILISPLFPFLTPPPPPPPPPCLHHPVLF